MEKYQLSIYHYSESVSKRGTTLKQLINNNCDGGSDDNDNNNNDMDEGYNNFFSS